MRIPFSHPREPGGCALDSRVEEESSPPDVSSGSLRMQTTCASIDDVNRDRALPLVEGNGSRRRSDSSLLRRYQSGDDDAATALFLALCHSIAGAGSRVIAPVLRGAL